MGFVFWAESCKSDISFSLMAGGRDWRQTVRLVAEASDDTGNVPRKSDIRDSDRKLIQGTSKYISSWLCACVLQIQIEGSHMRAGRVWGNRNGYDYND